MYEDNFAEELIMIRGKNGLTQRELAEKLGVSQRSVAMWEAGASVPRKTVRIKLATLYGSSRNEFLQAPVSNHEQETESKSISREKLLEELGMMVNRSNLHEEEKKYCIEALQSVILKQK